MVDQKADPKVDPKSIIIQAIKAINSHDIEGCIRLASPDCEFMSATRTFRGHGELRTLMENYFSATSDTQLTVDRVLADGSTVVVELTDRESHTGNLKTQSGVIPPTGKRFTLSGIVVATVEGDRIVRWREYWDRMHFVQQLGLMPMRSSPSA
jgi:steroid delta-isomerase-like uncharacterized protein